MPEKRIQVLLPKVASDTLEVYWRMLELMVQLLVTLLVLATVKRGSTWGDVLVEITWHPNKLTLPLPSTLITVAVLLNSGYELFVC